MTVEGRHISLFWKNTLCLPHCGTSKLFPQNLKVSRVSTIDSLEKQVWKVQQNRRRTILAVHRVVRHTRGTLRGKLHSASSNM